MSTVVAVVKSVIGQVVALSPEGVQRQLFEGDRIFQGDEIVTGAASMVTIELPDGRLIDLGRDTRWASNEFAPQAADDGAAQTAPSAEELQQAIAAGVDPTQAFEATAAGATSAGGSTSGGEAGGGRSFVLLDPTGGVVEAQIGFATQGLANGASGTTETQGALPNIAPQFTGADGGPITTFSLSTPEDTPISGTFTARDANGDLITFSVTQGPANGTLVFNPNGTWTYTPAQDYNGADSFVVTATDGRGASTPLTVNLGITPVNDAPVASGTYTADVNDTAGLDTFADIKGQLTATDVDDTQLTWSGSGKGAYGELTVNADGTYTYVVDAKAVNGLQDGEKASDSFVVTVRDPSGASDTRVITINFNGANDAPIATASSADVTEDQTVSGTLQASDADKGAVLSYSLTDKAPAGFSLNPQTGAWTLDAGNAAYQSLAEGQKLTLTVPYEVTDQFGAKSTSTLTITVTGVNDAAVLGSADVQLDETDSALTTGGTLSITDIDSPATFVAQTGTAGNYGTFSINAAGNWTYVANAAYNELNVGQKLVDTFQVTSADGTKTSVTVTINGTNDAAVLSSADVQLDETDSALTAGGALTITDVDSPATFVAQTGTAGTYGTFSIDAAGNWTYVANSAYNELNVGQKLVDTFEVTSADGTKTSVTVTINGTNDAPVAVNDTVTLDEDSVATGNVLTNDSDVDSTSLSVTGFSIAGQNYQAGDTAYLSVGKLTLLANGEFSFTPNADYSGVVPAVTYTLSDGSLSTTGTLQLVINPINDAPVNSVPGAQTLDEDGSQTFSTANGNAISVTDVDGDTLTTTLSVGHGTLTLGNLGNGVTFSGNGTGTLVLSGSAQAINAALQGLKYVPSADYNGQDTLNVRTSDGQLTDNDSIGLTINPVNDAPVAGATDAATEEDAAPISGQLDGSDVDGDTLTYTLSGPAPDGFQLNPNGTWTLDPSAAGYQSLAKGQVLTLTIPYSVSDGSLSAKSTLTITVTGTNDAPKIDAATAAANEGDGVITGQMVATDVDNGAQLTFTTPATVDGLTLNSNGSWSFDSSHSAYDSLKAGEQLVIKVPVTVTDEFGASNTANLEITVTGTNDAPMASAVSASGSEDQPARIQVDLAGSDVDGTVTGFVITGLPQHGQLYASANGGTPLKAGDSVNGPVYFVPDSDWNGTTTFQYQAVDNNGATSTNATATINVSPVNDAPVASPTSTSATEDGPTVGGQLAATDVDGDKLTFSLKGNAPAGFSLNPDGTWTLDPSNAAYQSLAAGEKLVIQVPFTATDGQLSSDSVLTLTITGVNDVPVVTGAISVGTDEDAAGQVIDLLAKASDTDANDVLNVVNLRETSGNDASGVTVSGNTLVLDPSAYNYLAKGEKVTLTYEYQVSDGHGGLVTTQATVVIDGVNDAPVVSAAIATTTNEDAGAQQVDLLQHASDVDRSDVLSVANVKLVGSGDTAGVTVSGNTLQVNPNAYNYLAAGEKLVLTYSYDVVDGNGGVTPTTATLTIEGRNDAPVLETTVQTGSVTERADGVPGENAGNLSATGDIGFEDADLNDSHSVSTQLVSATDGNGQAVAALGNLAATLSDSATGDGQGSVHWTYSVPAGSLDYLAAGETLTLVYRVTVTDGSNASASRDVTITVTGSNDAPVVSGAITSVTNEDAPPYSINLLQNASDVDAKDVLSVINLKQVGTGNAAGVTFDAASNSLKVDPSAYNYLAKGQNLVLNYEYEVSDGHGGLIKTSASVTIEGRNDAPVVDSNAITVAEESVGTPLGLKAPTDVDGDALTITVTGLPVVGRVTLADGTTVSNGQTLTSAQLQGLKYNAPADYKAGDPVGNFTYSVNDGTTTVVGSVAVSVTPVNDLPVVDSKPLTVAEESVGTPLGLKAPTDADGDVLTIKVTGLPVVGQVTLADGSLVSNGQTLTSAQLQGLKYNAPADYKAGDPVGSFTYSVNDGTATVNGSVAISVTPVNDLPVVDSKNLTVAEESVGTPLGLKAPTDADGDVLTIKVTGLPVVGQITLADGSLVSNGQTLTSAQLQGLKYNAPADYKAGDPVGSFTYSVNDGTATVNGSVTLGVTPVNDAPDARDDAPTLSGLKGSYYAYREGTDGPNLSNLAMVKDFIAKHAADATFTATTLNYGNGVSSDLGGNGNLQKFLGSDAATLNTDPANTSDAIVELSGSVNLAAGNYQLRVTADDGFSIVIDGKVVAEYNGNQGPTAREFATFNVPAGGAHQIQIIYWDQGGQAQLKVEMRPEGGSYTVLGGNSLSHGLDGLVTAEDTPLTIEPATLLGNDTDVDGDSLTIISVQNAVNGTVALVNGKVVFTPAANFNGTGSFTYTVSDGKGGTDTATVKVGVTAVNDLPVVDSHGLTVNEESVGTPLGIKAPTDVDGDVLTIKVTGLPVVGQVTLADGTLVSNGQTLTSAQLQGLKYNAPADYKAGDAVGSFTYSVNDGTATVNGTINLAVNPINDLPVVNNANVSVDEDSTLISQLNATDADGDSLTYTLKTGTNNGTLVFDTATGQYTYKPNANYNGPDSFTVTVNDGKGGVVDAVVRITVNPVNDIPTSKPLDLITVEDNAATGKIDARDVDGDTLTYSIANGNGPQHGTVTLNPDGTFSYMPAKDYNGTDAFTVTISDGHGGVTTSLVSINILPFNDAPETTDQAKETDEDKSVSGQIVATDVDGDKLSYVIQSGVAHGSILLNTVTGAYTYTPNKDFNGTDTFTVRVYDPKGGYADSVVTVKVNPVNDAPTASPLFLDTVEDNALLAKIDARDVDGDTLTYTIANGNGPQHGTVTLNPDGTFSYMPAKDYNGTDAFTVTIDDGHGGVTTSVVNINVLPFNDAPETTDQTKETDEDKSVSGQIVATDVDGDKLVYTIQSGVAHGSILLNTATGAYTYTPNKDFNGTDSFTIRVYDPKGGYADSVVTVKVNPVNDAPTSGPQFLTTDEDTPIDGRVIARDVDGDTLTYSIANGNGPQHGTVVMNADGTYTYQPAKDFNGTDTFTVTIDDGHGGTTTSLVSVIVNPVNDAPNAPNSTASVDEDGTLTSRIPATDAEGDTLTYAVKTGTTNGTLVLNPNTGEYTYKPNGDYNGPDSFVVTVSDGKGGVTDTVVNITVKPINDAPTASPSSISTDEDTPVDGRVTGRDVDGDTLTYTIANGNGPQHGTVVMNADGTYTYQPAKDFNGTDAFTVTISDGHGGTTTSVVSITVKPVNDAPVAPNSTASVDEDGTLTSRIPATDVDGDRLTYTVKTGTANGTLTLDPNTGEYTYKPNGDYNGPDRFVVTVSDGKGGVVDTVVDITVKPVNDAPTAVNDTATTQEDTPVTIDVLANDRDVDGDSLTLTGASAQHGSVSIVDGKLVYTPTGNYSGADTITYTVTDGKGGNSTATVQVGIQPVADAPNLGAQAPSGTPAATGLLQQSWNNLALGSGGNGANPATLKSTIDAAGTPTSSGNLADAHIDSVNAGVANKLSGLIYLEAGQTYTFSGTGDDSVMVVVGGTTVGSATWGGNSGQFSGSYTAQQSGYYTLDIYQHNQSGPGTLDVNVKVGNGPVQDLSSANVQLYTKASDLAGNGLHLSDLHGSDGKGYYQLYNVNEGDEDSSIPLSRLTASLNDTDGSESLSVGISQIPAGATLTDGVHSFTAISGSTTADISGWNLGNLSITPPANYNGTFDLKVTATATEGANGDKASTSLTLPVTVHPVSDAPTGADNTVQTDEGTPRSFSAAEFGFSDVDAGDSLKAIRINSLPGNGSLSLNGTAVTVGMLVTAAQIASLVYTPTASGSSSGSFSFSVQDQSGLFSSQPNTMTIQVANLDDAPGLANSTVTFAENTAAGTTIADLNDRFTGTDQDRDGEPLFYSITGGNDAGLFSINASTGVITLANGKTLDYETATQHQLQVSATDGKTAATATVTVNVTNVNDNGVVISDSDTAANQVNENAANGTVVGVTAKGVDGDVGATITKYELVDNAGGRFAINATTGVVTVADGTKLDYESATSHTIVVKATSSDGSTNTQSFTIQVGNVNDNGVVITDSDTTNNFVNENAATGTVVGVTAKGVDGDVGATITQYELTDNAGGRFAINATTGVVTVADGTKLDFESATSHTIVVKATSSDGSTNTQSFTIQVGNVNDNGVVITDSNTATNQVNENAANGTVVGITAKGVDGDVGATITKYELVDNAGGRFAIDATTGVVTVADGTKLDFESATSHTIVVKATSSDGSTANQSFTIQVNNVNEAPVVVAGANVTGVEDTNYVFAWNDFKVSDVDSNSTLSIKIESLPLEGKLQQLVNGTWTNVAANASVTKSVIDAGGLRFVPDSNESGHDSFGGSGVGLNQATYATFKYSGSDGALSTASSTMSIDITPVADVPTLTVKSAAASTLFTTTWESAPNSDNTSQDVAGPTFENWSLVTTGDVRSGGKNVFEVWASGDSMQNQAGSYVTVKLPGTNNGNALELNDAGGSMSQTLGVTRNVTTEVGKVYELNLDYAGRSGFDTSFTKIAVYLGTTLVGEYSSTSSQTGLNWENIHFSFTGTGKTEALTIKLAGTSTDSSGRGALIDNITLTSSQGVVAGDGGVSGKTSIALANYISGALTDTDGSESLRYDLSNLPSGASVVVGNTTLTANAGVVSLTAAQLATAKLLVSGSVRGEIGLDIKAVSVEPNGNTASSASQHLTLKIVDGGVGHESLTTNTINVADTSTSLSSGLTGEYWGYAESGSVRPNLTSLKLVEDYVESRTGNSTSLIGSNDNAAAASVNATFVANVIDYGLKNGTTVFSDDLGDNRTLSNGATIGTSGNSQNNLYDFLTAASTGNVSNLKAGGAGLGDTSDAIIRAHGFLDLAQGGTYDIRVTADDGYRLLIGGQVVAEADYIQSTTTKVFSGVGLSGDLQALELLYWDQGGAASLKVEFKPSGSADSAYKVLGASGSGLEIFQAPGAGQELVQTDTGWALHTIGTTNGTEASDLINGSKYSDILNGGNGHDVLYGNAGNDLLNGGDGNDLLIGGVGNDILTGGAGADIFVWKAGDLGNDVIKDFNAGEGDRIDLSDLLPDAANANNILDYLKVDTATSTLQVSTSGNVANGADVTIKLEGVDLTQYGSTSSQIVSSLVAGSDPLVKTEHS
ncbi:retention module-containing protein [Metapseudomonas otitidis]|uniref:retention module-containing protein n=1 Tax=Metapseudomonas otitidis TaxID=319939 RepID=UPI001F25EA08|nr:retention module-containing protein [Pseudomonas otitidis]